MPQSPRDPAVIETKRHEARRAVNAFVETLTAEELPRFADAYRAVSSALEAGTLEQAIELERAIPRGGMGSLSDIYPKDGQQWGRTFREASQAIAALRVYLSYGIDAPRHNDNNRNVLPRPLMRLVVYIGKICRIYWPG